MSDEARFTLVLPEERAPHITGCRDTHVLAEDTEGNRTFVPREWLARTEPSTVTDEGLVERVARAIAAEDNEEGYDAWEANPSELGRRCWFEYARAALEASGHTALLREIEALREALDKSRGCVARRWKSATIRSRVMGIIDAALSRPLVGGNNPKP
jgi:hypothetical protein